MKMTKPLIYLCICTLLFFGIIIFEGLSDDYVLIKDKSEINILAKKVKYKKGMVMINDSISIFGNCPMIVRPNTNNTVLGDFSGPYRLVKQSYNDTVKIVIMYDTLYFKYIDISK